MRLNATSVVFVGLCALTSHIAYVLLRGAKSQPRRELGASIAVFSGYCALIVVAHELAGRGGDALFAVDWWLAMVAALGLLRFVVQLQADVGVAANPLRRWVRGLTAGIAVAGLVLSLAGAWRVLSAGDDFIGSAILPVSVAGTLAVSVVVLAVGLIRAKSQIQSRALRSFLVPTLLPVASILADVSGSHGAPIPYMAFSIFRDSAVLLFCYGLLTAYMDYGAEAISLRFRVSVGALTLVLTVLLAVCEAFIRFDAVRGTPAEPQRALVLILLIGGSTVMVWAVVPRLYRRNLLEPVDRLVEAMQRVERGERDVKVQGGRDDEIGYVSASFNRMVASMSEAERGLNRTLEELRTRNAEIQSLNEDLRRQVVARSRDLAEAVSLVEPKAVLRAGDVVDESYRIEEVIGQGGMGTVYAARRVRDDRPIALKIMSGLSTEEAARFAREAEIAAQLDHPNLVPVIDVGVWLGRPYLVMERMDAGSLEDRRTSFGDARFALELLGPMASGLAALHARGIVHRDLKPGNILLSHAGTGLHPRLSDFGIARQETAIPSDASAPMEPTLPRGGSLTATGVMLGTLAYMAPELAHGAKLAGPPADVFALGIIAYELFTGRFPFDMPPVMTVMAKRALAPPAKLPPEAPSRVSGVVLACLEEAPGRRPTAQAVEEACSALPAPPLV